ncbi:MAG: peptidylprolyl isomerase [Parvularculaceae bacterium]|nr:peptidylprolyl isomerase [Parvularculaceae bacterium]
MSKLSDRPARGPLSKAGRVGAAGGRLGLKGLKILWRALAKTVATIWRLTGALDAALWRGVKLGGRTLGRWLAAVWSITGRAVSDLLAWLPSRSGRAYSAFSGVILILALLWIVDELRGGSTLTAAPADGSFSAPIDASDPILARIDGRYVHLSEVASAALASGALQPGETLTPAEAFRRELVSAYVEQRLLSRAATEQGLQREPEVARKLLAARDRILAAAFMERKLGETVTDDQVKKIYERNADATRLGEAVKCRHIVVATEEEANAILAELAAGADFGEIARARSLDRATGPQGGETGYLSRNQMTPAFAEAAFSTPEGEIAPLFFTEAGWNILEVVDRRRSGGVPFSEVAAGIRRFLTLRTIEKTVVELQEESDVVYFPVTDAPAAATEPPAAPEPGETSPGG